MQNTIVAKLEFWTKAEPSTFASKAFFFTFTHWKNFLPAPFRFRSLDVWVRGHQRLIRARSRLSYTLRKKSLGSELNKKTECMYSFLRKVNAFCYRPRLSFESLPPIDDVSHKKETHTQLPYKNCHCMIVMLMVVVLNLERPTRTMWKYWQCSQKFYLFAKRHTSSDPAGKHFFLKKTEFHLGRVVLYSCKTHRNWKKVLVDAITDSL